MSSSVEGSAHRLVLLCTKHHTQLHDGDFGIERGDDGTLTFRTKYGHLIAPSPTTALVALADRSLATTVPATTNIGGNDIWDGHDKPDYNMSVTILQTFEAEAFQPELSA